MERISLHDSWSYQDNAGAFATLLGAVPSTEVTLPHDAMLAAGREAGSPNQTHTGYFRSGAWVYERSIEVPKEWRDRSVILECEGVYRDAVIKVNGQFAAQRPNGYALFHVDLTPYLRYGSTNTLSIECRSHHDSRWYPGGGITRPVSLLLAPQVHLAPTGPQVTTLSVDAELATLEVTTPVTNSSAHTATSDLEVEIRDASGAVVARNTERITTLAGETQASRLRLYVPNPALWSPEEPTLYSAAVCLRTATPAGEEQDTASDHCGIRTLQLDPIHGLRINGVETKLRGACIHNDNGPIGGACFAAAEARRVRILKEAGFNALRSSHNPMSRAMLEACDRLGMLVMDELADQWTDAKTTDDYAGAFPQWWDRDVESLVAKDFNHPSVIMYSIGNEIMEVGNPHGSRRGRLLAEKVRRLDPTRYVTNAINPMLAIIDEFRGMAAAAMAGAGSEGAEGGAGDINTAMADAGAMMSMVMTHPSVTPRIQESSDVLDVLGLNYADARYELEHEVNPNRIVVGSETFPHRIGEYWRLTQAHPYVLGDFTWTGWDYLGEAGIARPVYSDDQPAGMGAAYPYLLAGSGDIDITGHRKTVSYYREVVFGLRRDPFLAVQRPDRFHEAVKPHSWTWSDSRSSWTWDVAPGSPVRVEAYAQADEVSFVLNGREVARTAVGEELPCYATADITYEPGSLEVVAYRGGVECGRDQLTTAGSPQVLAARAEESQVSAAPGSLAFVPVEILDAEGRLVPTADRPVTVTVEGAGVLQGLGSARPSHEESFLASTFTTYEGRALAVIRPTGLGEVRVRVSAEGLPDAEVAINVTE